MSFSAFKKSIQRIVKSKDVNRVRALSRYIHWQLRKFANLFPTTLIISESALLIDNKIVANHGGGLIATYGMYDYNNMNLIRFLLNAGNNINTFFDIGAHIGTYTLIASEIKTSKVYSFEPHPYTFGLLSKNLLLNKRENVVAVNKAVSHFDGRIYLTNQEASTTNKTVIVNHHGQDVIQVEAISMSTFCSNEEIVPRIVKIDVEGLEKCVLNGFNKMINQVNIFIIETLAENLEEVKSILGKANFVGPLYFQYKRKTFHKKPFTVEDPAFVRIDFLEMLKKEYGISLLN